jgi:hypothetical protein
LVQAYITVTNIVGHRAEHIWQSVTNPGSHEARAISHTGHNNKSPAQTDTA